MAEWLVSHCTELLSASPSLWPLLLSHLFLQSWKPKLSKSQLTTKNTNLPHQLWMYSSAKAFKPTGMFASAILTLPSALFPKYLVKDPFPWRKEQTPCDNTFSSPAKMQKRLEKECQSPLFPTLPRQLTLCTIFVPTCCKLNNFCDSSIGGIWWNVARSYPESISSGPQGPQSHQVSIMSGRPASRGIMFDKQRPRTTTSETSPARRTRVWQVVIHQRWKPGRPKPSLAGAHREPPASSGYRCSNDL